MNKNTCILNANHSYDLDSDDCYVTFANEINVKIRESLFIEQFCNKCNLSFLSEKKMIYCSKDCGLDFIFDPLENYRKIIYSCFLKNFLIEDIQAIKRGHILMLIRKPSDDDELKDADRNKIFFDVERLRKHKQISLYENLNTPYGTQIRSSMSGVWTNLAVTLSSRSTCIRNHVGAVITDENDKRVISIGYNGNAPKLDNACDTLEPGKCGCIHAEINAIANASESLNKKHLFVTVSPCISCAKMILSAGINQVTYLNKYRTNDGINLLVKNGVYVKIS